MATDTNFDWCSFFALFWNVRVAGCRPAIKDIAHSLTSSSLAMYAQDKGLKCKINFPDTVLFRYGQLSAWWATNKVSNEGNWLHVLRNDAGGRLQIIEILL